MKVSHSKDQHVADMADMRSEMTAVIKEEIRGPQWPSG